MPVAPLVSMENTGANVPAGSGFSDIEVSSSAGDRMLTGAIFREQEATNLNPRSTLQVGGRVPLGMDAPIIMATTGRFMPDKFSPEEAQRRVMVALEIEEGHMMSTPTIQQVLGMVSAHHENVTRREMENMADKVDRHCMVLDRAIMRTREEMQFIAQEVRSAQLELSRRQCVIGGFPASMVPTTRNALIACYLLKASENLKYHLYSSTGKQIDPWKDPHALFGCLATEPTTISTGAGTFGAISILTFTSFDARRAFCDDFKTPFTVDSDGVVIKNVKGKGKGTGKAQAIMKLRVTPSSPLYQRKKEGLLRCFMSAINTHPDYASKDLIPLWHTLTLMEPQDEKGYDDTAEAWLRISFIRARSTGELVAQCTMTKVLHDIISHVPEGSSTGESLWQLAWQSQWFSRQLEEDRTEVKASHDLDKTEAEGRDGMEVTAPDDAEAGRMQERANATGGDEEEAYYAEREADRRQTTGHKVKGIAYDNEQPLPTLDEMHEMEMPRLTGRHWGSAFTRQDAETNPFPFHVDVLIATTVQYEKGEYIRKFYRSHMPAKPHEEQEEDDLADADVALRQGTGSSFAEGTRPNAGQPGTKYAKDDLTASSVLPPKMKRVEDTARGDFKRPSPDRGDTRQQQQNNNNFWTDDQIREQHAQYYNAQEARRVSDSYQRQVAANHWAISQQQFTQQQAQQQSLAGAQLLQQPQAGAPWAGSSHQQMPGYPTDQRFPPLPTGFGAPGYAPSDTGASTGYGAGP